LLFRKPFLLLILAVSGCSTLTQQPDNSPVTAAHAPTELVTAQTATPLFEQCLAETTDVDPEAYDNLWVRIRNQLAFDIPDNQRVRAQKSWYQNHPEYMQRVTERASPYLYFVVQELEKNHLPIELALLPIVESAYDPFAYSHGRASGMWQFIPGTGKMYGLQSNWWYDGRRDVYYSTQAAIKLLSYLRDRFDGNWLYALAAYNSGEGNVVRAIRQNKKAGKSVDFWSLKLPSETRAYVPKLLALADMLAHGEATDDIWTPVENEPYFDRVATGGQIDLSLAADLAEISMKDFYEINPAYNQWATAPKGPHQILLPLESIETFQRNLAQIPTDQRISYKNYKIQAGDSLLKIAKQFSTSVELLREHNEIRGNNIRVGHFLKIPIASEARNKYYKSTGQRLLASQNADRKGTKFIHTVQAGDSFWELARKYKVNLRKLAKWNNMAPTDPLRVGQQLVLWSEQPVKVASLADNSRRTKKIYYKVRQGDSLARIADKFNVSLDNVKKWNRSIRGQKYLQPGDSVTLYVDITRQY